MADTEELRKLKVDQLREQLSDRGLETKGKKEELVSRLASVIEDELLLRETEELPAANHAGADEAAVTYEGEAEQPFATTATPAATATTLQGTGTAASKSLSEQPASTVRPASTAAHGLPAASSDGLTEGERKKRRAERFNIPPSEAEKKAARAARFGMAKTNEQTNGTEKATKPSAIGGGPALDDEEQKRRRARAQRFGVPDAQLEEERKAARAKRFADPKAAEETAKRQKRMERFGATAQQTAV